VAQHRGDWPRCAQCAIRLDDAQLLHAERHANPPPWRCGACLHAPPPWQRGLAAVSYVQPWSGLLAAFKFRGDVGMARNLAGLLHATPGVAQQLAAADAVVPVPLSRPGLLARGFNQAELLARQLAPGQVRHALQRQHFDAAQHTQTRAQRLRRMQQAFSCAQPQAVHGLRLLLIDDVMTTGATLTAASQCLLAAGARHVDVLVLARTERSPRHDNPGLAPAPSPS
jgi:ComF family protein